MGQTTTNLDEAAVNRMLDELRRGLFAALAAGCRVSVEYVPLFRPVPGVASSDPPADYLHVGSRTVITAALPVATP